MSNIEEAIKNINVINVEEFHKEAEKRVYSLIEKYGDMAFLPNLAAPYDTIRQKMISTYPLDNPEELVDFCNPLFNTNKYSTHGWCRHGPVESFLLKNSDNNRKTKILFNYDLKGSFYPLIWFEKDSINQFAFFTSNDSKAVDGIYLYGSESIGSPHYIMKGKLYHELVDSQSDKLRKIAEK